jgi:hypothetical protein
LLRSIGNIVMNLFKMLSLPARVTGAVLAARQGDPEIALLRSGRAALALDWPARRFGDGYEESRQAIMNVRMAKPHDINADEHICKALDVFVERMAQDYDRATLGSLKGAVASELTNPKGTSLPVLTAAVWRIPGFQDGELAELVAKALSFGASNLANRWAGRRAGWSRRSSGTR